MPAHHVAAAAGGFAASRRGRGRLPRREELRLDAEFAAKGIKCFVCKKPMKKWVQVGSDWASGFYIECRNCGETGFKNAHNTCVPAGLGDSVRDKLARIGNKNIKKTRYGGYHFLVDQCDQCQS